MPKLKSKAIPLPSHLAIVRTNGGFWRLYSPWLEASEKVCTRTDSECPVFECFPMPLWVQTPTGKPYYTYLIDDRMQQCAWLSAFDCYDDAARAAACLNAKNRYRVKYVVVKNPYYGQYNGTISK